MRSATFETGLSDHHKLTATILRKNISKGKSKIKLDRDYKRFDQKKFETELKLEQANSNKLGNINKSTKNPNLKNFYV